MATTKLSYHRLKKEIWLDEEDDDAFDIREYVIGRLRNSRRLRSGVHIRRKLRVKIPRLMKRFLSKKRNVVKTALSKIYNRLKESPSHFGELFAGNYLFMQVTPTQLIKCGDHLSGNKSFGRNHDVHGLYSPRYSVPRIA